MGEEEVGYGAEEEAVHRDEAGIFITYAQVKETIFHCARLFHKLDLIFSLYLW